MSLVLKVHDISKIEYNKQNSTITGEQDGRDKNRIFAGDLKIQESSVEQKRKEAQKRALKIVSDTWNSDREMDRIIQERRDNSLRLEKESLSTREYIKNLETQKSNLKEQYGIEADSIEQRDLELLEKRQDFQSGNSSEMLTKEEINRLKEIDKKPLTEYQKRALEYNDQLNKYRRDLKNMKAEMQDDYADIRSIKQERLKDDPMVDAQKEAEDVLKSASKEIIGMLVDEAKETIDKKLEEEEVKSEKIAEEKEKKKEQQEEIQEKRAIQEAFIEKTKEAVEEAEQKQRQNEMPEMDVDTILDVAMDYNVSSGNVSKSLEEIKNSMALLEADLKGIQVDKEV